MCGLLRAGIRRRGYIANYSRAVNCPTVLSRASCARRAGARRRRGGGGKETALAQVRSLMVILVPDKLDEKADEVIPSIEIRTNGSSGDQLCRKPQNPIN